MPYDASADTLVCELRFPAAFGLMVAGAVLAVVAAVASLPFAVWLRFLLGCLMAGYAGIALWRWWRRMPARLAVTGDGRCRGLAAGGDVVRYGTVRDALVWRPFVVIAVSDRRGRHLFISRDMVAATEFRRLRARLRTVMSP